MAKLYTKKKATASNLLPKKETIQTILSYSAALRMVKVGKYTFEHIAN